MDPPERLLLRDNQTIPLAPKAFETLLLLVENSGHLQSKEELMKRLWPGTFVEEVNLAQNISAILRALDDKNGGVQYIETVSKGGYRFVGRVNVSPATAPSVPPGRQADETPALGTASGRFFAWVIGGALSAALDADWLTAAWDQNAYNYVTGPAAAVVEECEPQTACGY